MFHGLGTYGFFFRKSDLYSVAPLACGSFCILPPVKEERQRDEVFWNTEQKCLSDYRTNIKWLWIVSGMCRFTLPPPCRLGLLPKRTAVVFVQELATSKGKELECVIAENLRILENESFHCPHIVTNQTILFPSLIFPPFFRLHWASRNWNPFYAYFFRTSKIM
jgi:hypothetical protein